MPIKPLEKIVKSVKYSREQASEVTCNLFHDTVRRELNTGNVEIFYQPGYSSIKGTWFGDGAAIMLPYTETKLADIMPAGMPEVTITIKYLYTEDNLNPDTKMTRLEFVMQTLDIWNRMYSGTKVDNPIVAAMELLKTTYSFEELLPQGSFIGFKALFGASLPPEAEDDGAFDGSGYGFGI